MERVSFARRVGALFIDWIIALLSTAVITRGPIAGDGAPSSFLTLGVFLLEVGLTTGLLGYSIGKRVLRLRVESPDGRPIALLAGLLRAALICLVIPPLVTNKEGRGLHDVITQSRVAPLA